MPIAPLNQSTASAICSTIVLQDAVSVVKELIDNALDSAATNISIEISQNTIDVIQVKDNGSGIGVEDRQLLCKEGYTSKITTLDDLANLGGTFLGFRGEAVASIAKLSEAIVFTTRVEGESVGTFLKFDNTGKLASSASASHGVGTTVRVSNFLRLVPVRRQITLKNSTKVLANIRKLLIAYAYARPTVRIQFKVLKTKNERTNWSFVPSAEQNDLKMTASKLVGKDVVARCIQQGRHSDNHDVSFLGLFVDVSEVQAQILNSEQHISIDGRPLNIERGFAKDLVRQYKAVVKKALPNAPSQPFLYLRLVGAKGSYDVNVEPSKDEVLFQHPSGISELLQSVYDDLYGFSTAESSTQPNNHAEKHSVPPLAYSSDENHNMANRINQMVDDIAASRETDIAETSSDMYGQERSLQRLLGTMHNLKGEMHSTAIRIANDTMSSQEDTSDDIMDAQITNPFTLARMSTRIHPQRTIMNPPRFQPPLNPAENVYDNVSATESQVIADATSELHRETILLRPDASPEKDLPYQNPGPPNRPWRSRHCDSDEESPGSDRTSSIDHENPFLKTRLLDNWVKAINTPPTPDSSISQRQNTHEVDGTTVLTGCTLRSTDALPSSAPNKPFRLTLQRDKNGSSNISRGTVHTMSAPSSIRNAQMGNNKATTPRSNIRIGTASQTNIDEPQSALEDIMRFEHRKRDAILQHRSKAKIGHSYHAQKRTEGVPIDSDPHLDDEHGQLCSQRTASVPLQPSSASSTQNSALNRPHSTRQNTEQGYSRRISKSDRDPRILMLEEMKLDQALPVEGLQNPKPRRAKISNLPMERMMPKFSTFSMNAQVQGGYLGVETLPAEVSRVFTYDKMYAKCGLIQSVESDLQNVDSILLTGWLASARRLADLKYKECSRREVEETIESPL